jgi:hypothetical protein
MAGRGVGEAFALPFVVGFGFVVFVSRVVAVLIMWPYMAARSVIRKK